MKKYFYLVSATLIVTFLLMQSQAGDAGLLSYFKDEQGRTNWQYIANWSSGTLIILLSITVAVLFFSHRQIHLTNRAITRLNEDLEQRVRERTATLDEANQLLQVTNNLLEGEINQHRETTKYLHASETYIKSILESMPLMLVGLDKEGVVTQWNRAAERITGLKAEHTLNKGLWDSYPIMPISREKVAKALNENTPLHLRCSQRGQKHFEITVYPLAGDGNTGVVILIDDVTQQVLTENKLIERDKMSTMGELASTMAHDINPPLQGIIKELEHAQDLLSNRDPARGDAQLQTLQTLLHDAGSQGQRAAAIISNLLDFAGSHRGDLKPASITQIMDHALEVAADIFSLTQNLRFSDIEIVRDYEENLPEVPCFASELQQAFLSLLRHSCYALNQIDRSERQPKITVKVVTCYDALWIKVQHNGKGLSMEEQQVIFEPYFSNDSFNSNVTYDAGRRLSFAYFIITEHHEGHMAVTSAVEVGTTFHMELQLK
ncbi:MAG TPA: PAS domain S-box protein [Arenimonas sp.]|nr:PAS domain S-box protein [Arenimonas sp.]